MNTRNILRYPGQLWCSMKYPWFLLVIKLWALLTIYCNLFTTFIIEGNAKFQLEVSEKRDIHFSHSNERFLVKKPWFQGFVWNCLIPGLRSRHVTQCWPIETGTGLPMGVWAKRIESEWILDFCWTTGAVPSVELAKEIGLVLEQTTLQSPRLGLKWTQRKAELRDGRSRLLGNVSPFKVLIMEANALSITASLSRAFCSLQWEPLQLIRSCKASRIPGTKWFAEERMMNEFQTM